VRSFGTAGKTYYFLLSVTGLRWTKLPAESIFYLTLILTVMPVVAEIFECKVIEKQQCHNDSIPSQVFTEEECLSLVKKLWNCRK